MTNEEIQLIWSSPVWQLLIAGFIAGFIGCLIANMIAVVFGYPQAISEWGLIIGTLAAFPIGFRTMKVAINKFGLK